MSEEEEWTTPSSSSLEEASIELGIEPISAPEVGSSLTEVNAVVRKSGLSCLARDQSVNIFYSRYFLEFFFIFFFGFDKKFKFNAIYSSIYHYNAASQAVCDSVWDVITRAFKVESQNSKPIDPTVLRKATYLMCILMNETIKKSNKKSNKDANILEDRFSKWTKNLKFLMKGTI